MSQTLTRFPLLDIPAPSKSPLQWNARAVERRMRAAGIPSRHVLAERLEKIDGIGRSTVYRSFDWDWRGDVSIAVLAGLMKLLGASVDDLVTL